MALSDIDFAEGEKQLFTLEIPLGSLHAPTDELADSNSARYPVLETVLDIEPPTPGDIFIITE